MRIVEEMREYNHDEIIGWLEKKFEDKKIYKELYKALEESPEFRADVEKAKRTSEREFFLYPRLTIDLICVKEETELIDEEQTKKTNGEKKKPFNHYTLFFAVSSKTIPEDKMKDLKERLSFYQFYLSRISEPKRFRIIVVVPHYTDIPRENLKFFEENGFGLWKVNIEEKKDEEVCKAKSLRERMIEKFKASVDNREELGETVEKIFKEMGGKDTPTFKEAIKKEAEDFAVFFDQYILDTVDAIAGVTPDKFGERYIDRGLLNRVLKLEKVSYGKRLSELVNEHLDENYDDYEFVSEVFSVLWEENIGLPYSNFLSTFEPVLLHVFAKGEEREREEKFCRDHYIHQFQVFLLGLYIINQFYDNFEKYKSPELSWLIASSFHDMAYPVQHYDEWSKKFFKKVFNVPIELAYQEFKSNFVDKSFLSCMGYLIWLLYLYHKGEKVKGNWLADKNELVQFFYKEITERKNHCILSSMSLLKMVQDTNFNDRNTIKSKISNDKLNFDDILKKFFVPSALAIALHDKEVWQGLRKESSKDNPPKILDNLEFEKDPLSFLLIFCDSIQEWGRPSKSRVEERDREMRFRLQDIKSDPKTSLDITIYTPGYTKDAQFFVDKQDELRSIQFFLKQRSDMKFTVHLRDKKGKGEDFEMQGSPP